MGDVLKMIEAVCDAYGGLIANVSQTPETTDINSTKFHFFPAR